VSRGPRRETERRFNNWSHWFREYGSVYSDSFEADEALEIRVACEQMGVPMGFGRVPRAPIQLSDAETRAQFRARRR
jgi:hypothetical protein